MSQVLSRAPQALKRGAWGSWRATKRIGQRKRKSERGRDKKRGRERERDRKRGSALSHCAVTSNEWWERTRSQIIDKGYMATHVWQHTASSWYPEHFTENRTCNLKPLTHTCSEAFSSICIKSVHLCPEDTINPHKIKQFDLFINFCSGHKILCWCNMTFMCANIQNILAFVSLLPFLEMPFRWGELCPE